MEQIPMDEFRVHIHIKKVGVNNVDWSRISALQKLSESFIREFAHKVDWFWISIYQKLSESFIREFADRVDWIQVSIYQRLSESFIRKFANKVNWGCISQYQKLSKSFIRKFVNKLPYKFDAVIANEFHCGPSNRPIHIYKSNPTIIHMGCFRGTKAEALTAVDNKYSNETAEDYKRKIRSCFRQIGG